MLVPGARAPKLITREMLSLMPKGAVIVDVAIDQGGCAETSRPTFHSDPVYMVDWHHPLLRGQHARRGAAHLHLCPDQRHPALCLAMANKGFAAAAGKTGLLRGVNVHQGKITNREVADAQGGRGSPRGAAPSCVAMSGHDGSVWRARWFRVLNGFQFSICREWSQEHFVDRHLGREPGHGCR